MADALVVQHAQTVLRVVHGEDPNPQTDPTPIGASWTRCVNDYHLEPSRLYSPTVVDHSRLQSLQDQHSELIEIARAEMDSLYEQISGSGYALLLTDANGIILCDKVDPTLRQMFRSAGLIGGADWSEQHEGTNGIGTCITEGRSVTIHRADHFRSRHIGLSCSGAPIRDTGGDVIAVLDASSVDARDTRSSQMHTMALVNFSAHMIEKCLFLRRHQHQTVLRFHHRPELVNLLHDGAIAISDDGLVLAADATAAKLLGCNTPSQLVGHAIDELFDGGVRELAHLGGSARHAIWQLRDLRHGRQYFACLSSSRQILDAPPPMPTRPIRTVVEVAPCEYSNSPMTLDFIAGSDPQMLRIARSASRIAKSNVSVLIRGPTGSGKECFAKALHLASDRADKPYVAVNCAAIPESLIESELFGYKSGAFTGARKEGMRGKVLQSNGGTLFLDEIGDMPLLLQTRLLRVLEEREVVPLGSETPIKVDLRVICASHRDLRVMMDQGTFREDLFYRLNGITLELPALAKRSDKEQLIRQIIAAETSSGRPVAVEAEAFQHLMDYPWPGNIRELRNVIRTALAICEGGVIRVHDLPGELRSAPGPSSGPAAVTAASHATAHAALPAPPSIPEEPAGNCLEAAERAALISAIERNRWNMSQTAAELGMSRNTLYRKIKRHAIPIGTRRWDML